MPSTLVIAVNLHGAEWNGQPEWPPSPARLFQALVAGAARGAHLSPVDSDALRWLEGQTEAPVIAAPRKVPRRKGDKGYVTFVPNNDLDAVGHDPSRISEVRAGKHIQTTLLLDPNTPLLYLWRFDDVGETASLVTTLCSIASRLYQFGRGVDMAWARGEVVTPEQAATTLANHPGTVHRPTPGAGNTHTLLCPTAGTFDSLCDRFAKTRQRFKTVGKQTLFSQPPKAVFAAVAYDCPQVQLMFDLRDGADLRAFAPWPMRDTEHLTRLVRDKLHERLTPQLPNMAGALYAALVGGTKSAPSGAPRVQIVPLPSIGHTHADHGIRRVLVAVPPGCALQPDDIAWAAAGQSIASTVDAETGEISHEVTMVAGSDQAMARHYFAGLTDAIGWNCWQSVTPVALPETAARRRIEPSRMRQEAKGGNERVAEEQSAVFAVRQALRHVDQLVNVIAVQVQREPWTAKGVRAESFGSKRFGKHQLWHVALTFAAPIRGPLILGDGRYFGLGLFAPVRQT